MDALRWILLLIGLVLIAGIYWLGRRQGQDERREGLFERARRGAREDRGRDEPAADPVEPDLDIGDIDVHGFDVEDRPGEARKPPARSTPVEEPEQSATSRNKSGPARPGRYAPDDPQTAFDDPARGPAIDSGPVEPPPRETAATRARAEPLHEPEPEPEPVAPPDPAPDPGADPPDESVHGPGSSPDSEPVVARPDVPEDSPDTTETVASGSTSTDAESPPTTGRDANDREPRGGARDSGPEERVVVLHVVAPEGERLVGARLREALESCGMRHGAYSIFHASDSEGSIVFSAANAVEPGTFDRATMDTLTTPGIALFMQVPGAQSAETIFDRMLSTARTVADALEAHVLDERHSTLTRQTEQHLREELRLLDRRTGSLQR